MSKYPVYSLADADGHALASGPFDTQTAYTKIAMAVMVYGLIADMVSPRVQSPFKFTYTKLTEEDQLTIPDARASRAAKLREVEFGSTDASDVTEDYGLISPVPERDIKEAKVQGLPYDPLQNATMSLAELMKLLREKRVADLVFDDAQYPAGYKTTLAGNAQWNVAASDPLTAILTAMDLPLVRPNTLVFGQETWTKFRQNSIIVEAVKSTGAGKANAGEGGAAGTVSMQQVADLFELDQVLVGRAQHQTANRGQDDAYSYLWGKHAALLSVNRSMGSMTTAIPSFTFTAEAMPMQVGTYIDRGRGIGQGSTIVKVSESCKEVVSWNKAGYFFKNAVA